MSKRKIINIVITLIVGAIAWLIKHKFSSNDQDSITGADLTGAHFTEAKVVENDFTWLKQCSLVTSHKGNDGDSFKIKHEQGETEFRLYFVDAPESKFKSYRDGNDNGKRIDEQGAYFGMKDRNFTTSVGQQAKQFTVNLLTKNPFTIATVWENVYGPDRKYGFVIVDIEGKKHFLHELLIAKGLGRIHTKPHYLPQGRASYKQKDHLRSLETLAKKNKQGGWKREK